MIKKSILAFSVIPLLLVTVIGLRPAYAHNEIDVGNVKVEVGWGVEPPLQGQLNTIVFTVTDKDGKPVINAFADADISVKKGGLTKPLNVLPVEHAGAYAAQIIPSELGQYSVVLAGKIAGQDANNTKVVIEDVEDVSKLTFPEGGSGSQGLPKDFVNQVQGVITDLTSQVDSAKTSAQTASSAAQNATAFASETRGMADRAFLVGIVGVGVGVAGIAVAAIALSKRT
ncbi:MAG: hypothetical protein ABI347_05375 [Nitrososphaera sp.]|jgi:hypothetical protein